MRTLATLLFTLVLSAGPMLAQEQTFVETLDIGISTDEISIASDFTGADITIFGAIDRADPNLLAQGKYDIVVALEGPKDNTTVLKKERVFGIWINRRSMTFELVPASYSMSSTRDVEKIASPDLLNSTGVGLNHIRLTPLGYFGDGSDLGQFREAFRNRKEVDGLYQRDPGGVQFISSSLFKASVRLPANVPNGVHIVRAHLFRDGQFVTEKALPLRVVKTGIEEAITRAAYDRPLAYGFCAVLLAVATGWIASVAFRRD